MDLVKKIMGAVSSAMICSLLGIIVTMTILLICGVRPYITMSGSMEPAIRTGSLCFVNTGADFNDIRKGDVIAFETETGTMVTHRVIRISEGALTTQGDANDVTDGMEITYSNFRGKTLFSIPYAGYIIESIQKPQNMAMAAVILAAILLLNIIDELPKNKN